ncbi:MAG: spore coat protein [Bacillota bacterium]|nr:spore coat protein [Bacillota bacterium]
MQALPVGDKDIAGDVLMTEKRMAEMLVRATLEMMPGGVRNELQRSADDTIRAAEHVFNYMNRHNWYNPRNADPQTIGWFRNALDRMRSDLGSVWANRPGRFAGAPAGTMADGGNWGQLGPGPGWNRPDVRPGEPLPAGGGTGYGWPQGGFRPGGPGA